ncbi:MAG: restriction endonuclease subunit S [Candidatus Methanomethylophilaceae archaeon]|nr:restriction endonuclease subunit S [Candidatus Methanomethylophilaceae archaeon]
MKVGSGGTPKTAIDGYWNGGIPFFSPKDVDGIFTMSTEKEISQNGLDNCNSMLYPKNTVFITARGTVGKIAMAGCDMAMNQSCYAIIGQKSDNQHYIHQLCLDMVDSIRQKSNGAVFDAINAKDIESEPIILLQEDTIEEFEKIATPIYEMIWTNESQNAKLRSVRDVLLPKLMSGEIDVSNLDLGS